MLSNCAMECNRFAGFLLASPSLGAAVSFARAPAPTRSFLLSSGRLAVCANCLSVLLPEARFCPQCGLAVPKARQRIGPGSEVPLGDFGKCVLGHSIGEGGMGVVYRGWLYYNPAGRFGKTPPHPLALKVLHPLIRGRPRAERLFRHEAEILGQLSHPNVVHCFGL